MTRLQRVNSGRSHSYRLDGERVPGVTTIVGQLDKPALVAWAANTTAAYAVDNWTRLSEVPTAARLKELEGARRSNLTAASLRGSRLHAVAEAIQRGERAEVAAHLAPDAEAIARLLDEWGAETVATETPVGHTEHLYAGTLDCVIRSEKLGGAVLWDFKTGKGVYDETALQLAAYARADVMLRRVEVTGPRGGKTTSYVEQPMLRLDDMQVAYVAHARDGHAQLYPVRIDRRVYDVFLRLCDLWWEWTSRVTRDSPAYDPPVRTPIHPDVDVAAQLADVRTPPSGSSLFPV